jgi:hypothetical protein
MNDALFIKQWRAAPIRVKRALQDFARFPTEKNDAYCVGYLSGAYDAGSLEFDIAYWMAFTHQIKEGSEAQKFIFNAVKGDKLND